MKSLTIFGILLAFAGMAIGAVGLYDILHLETCLSKDIVANAEPCTLQVTGHAHLIVIGAVLLSVGLIMSWGDTFAWLFPLFWVVEGGTALYAGLTSQQAGFTNVSKMVGVMMGGTFVGVGLLLLVLYAATGMLSFGGRKRAGGAAPIVPAAPAPVFATPAPSTAPPTVPADRMTRIEDLRRQGLITTDEFEAKRAELLGLPG